MKMQKRQFRIGELAKRLGVERFVLRFWEKEFDFSTSRSTGGQRFYEEKDYERFQKIKELLYEKKFTIAGAKRQLKKRNTDFFASKTTMDEKILTPSWDKLGDVKKKLASLKELL